MTSGTSVLILPRHEALHTPESAFRNIPLHPTAKHLSSQPLSVCTVYSLKLCCFSVYLCAHLPPTQRFYVCFHLAVLGIQSLCAFPEASVGARSVGLL